jgi:RNA polymerase sigma-70 factor (ECF subfamily)
MAETDAELVVAVRMGDRDAAGRLTERYLRAARAVALSILHDIPSAEDVSQDAFVYAITRIDDCRDPARFGAWLLTIVRNRSRNALRDQKRGRMMSIEKHAPPSLEPWPDRQAELFEIRERLLAALRHLSEDRRVVILLHDLEGWTHEAIAAHLEMPAGTVRSHLHHARKKLRALLQDLAG